MINRAERLQRAIVNATKRLDSRRKRLRRLDQRPALSPGDLYVFKTAINAMIEWLVVRPHPDDHTLVLLAPADDFPLVGQHDIPLTPEFTDRLLTVRCGEIGWIKVPYSKHLNNLRVDAIPDESVAIVRRKIAALARGNMSGVVGADDDPNYIHWLGQVARARSFIDHPVDPST